MATQTAAQPTDTTLPPGAPPVSAGPARPTPGTTALQPVAPGAARITGGYWADRQRANRENAIPTGRERLESAGNLTNLRIAAGTAPEGARVTGPIFMDSDVYKWLEAAAWEHGREPSEQLLGWIRELTAEVAAAQAEDGYLDSVVQEQDGSLGRRGRYADLPWSHEMYCAGHLFQAAVAVVRATGERGLLDVAVRLADHLDTTFGDGEGQLRDVDGHPVVEMGLVELFRETGERRYLELARWMVEARGTGIIEGHGKEPTYFSDRVRVREATTVEGHAVRAVYLTAGAADVAAETDDAELLAALGRQFDHMLATKTYITGGLGSRWDMEAFGDPYELPSDRAYAETCAAIGGIQWAHRMLLATGEAKYADVAERMLHNGFPAGVSLSGDEYFYVNPLQFRDSSHANENRSPAHGRRGWFDCACCPPNIMRTISSLDGYLATTGAVDGTDGVQLHLFAPSALTAQVEGVGAVGLVVETGYPWDGGVRVRVDSCSPGGQGEPAGTAEWTLSVRVPAWAAGATARVAGQELAPQPGTYLRVTRTWAAGDVLELDLPLDVRLSRADRRVDDARGAVALERGPLVYALEQVDQPEGVLVDDVVVDGSAPVGAEHRDDLLGGVVVLHPRGRSAGHEGGAATWLPATDPEPAPGEDVELTAVPYAVWANRGVGPMRVWLPVR
ncbi:glycoside hydrolase family 127 protein [Streptomyces sp. NP160]|uniref:glycoside hydrolase family 127 protein n=1 Tax=Streptomyces sp. NP160 TaxID=2586637 RepID=UPI00214C55DB|nr:glycoside hydrolase family 127 protein [Streptomyces sp. NP160]